jgi:hypothetical protein
MEENEREYRKLKESGLLCSMSKNEGLRENERLVTEQGSK